MSRKLSSVSSKDSFIFYHLYSLKRNNIDFKLKLSFQGDSVILVDNSTVGHLGVEYVVIKDSSLSKKIGEEVSKIESEGEKKDEKKGW